jgi:hypothetical protein
VQTYLPLHTVQTASDDNPCSSECWCGHFAVVEGAGVAEGSVLKLCNVHKELPCILQQDNKQARQQVRSVCSTERHIRLPVTCNGSETKATAVAALACSCPGAANEHVLRMPQVAACAGVAAMLPLPASPLGLPSLQVP